MASESIVAFSNSRIDAMRPKSSRPRAAMRTNRSNWLNRPGIRHGRKMKNRMRERSLAATFRVCLLTATILGSFSGVSLAGPNADAKILIHLLAPTTKGPCTRAEATPPCSSIVTAGDLYPATYFAYVLVTDADSVAGVAGVQFGIGYDDVAQSGIDIYSWTNCATLEFAEPGWPGSGTGNLVTWNNVQSCQRSEPEGSGTGVKTVVGYLYCAAYSADTLRITLRSVDSVAAVAACDSRVDTLDTPALFSNPYPLGFATFESGAELDGYNPCGPNAGQGFRSPSPPTEPRAQAELHSSQFDPLNPPIELPHVVTVSEQHSFIIHGHIFEEGEELEFAYDPDTQRLTANGILALDYSPPEPAMDGSPGELWMSAFIETFLLAPEGTAPRDRAQRAIEIVDKTGLNPDFKPIASDGSAKVWFGEDADPTILMYPRPAPSEEERFLTAAADATGLVKFIQGQSKNERQAFVWLLGEGHIEYYWGDKAVRVPDFISRATQTSFSLSEGERNVASDLNITDADLERIISVARGGGK